MLLSANLSYPKRVALANTPTPLRPLDRLSKRIGGPRIWLKCDDLTGSVLSGNKVRKLEFLAAEAITQGCSRLITCGGLQSNHCRATAAVAAELGLASHLVLRGPPTLPERAEPYSIADLADSGLEGNVFLDQLFAAQIAVYSPRFYMSNLDEILFETARRAQTELGEKSYIIPTGGSNAVGLWGYIHAAAELEADFHEHCINPSTIVCATGSGGTQGGLTLGCHLLGEKRQVCGMAVCDSDSVFDAKIRSDVQAWQAAFDPAGERNLALELKVQVNDKYIGPGYAQGYPALFEFIRLVARTEGVVLDPVYTGKAFYGLSREIALGAYDSCSDIVFVHTGGIFGLFPFRYEVFE